MRSRIRAGGAALAVAVLAALTPYMATAATSPDALAGPAKPLEAGTTTRVVTLITGDKVTVVTGSHMGATVAGITRGKGRAGITFVTTRVAGRIRVIPSDALPLLRSGRIDVGLFDVSALIDFGYDDRRADLPLIVTGDRAATRSRTSGLAGARAVRDVPGGTALRAAKAEIGGVWQGLRGGLTTRATGMSKVWLDRLRKPVLDQSVPQIGAPAAWAAGFTGAGVKVAVLDTGVDSTHPDLAGRVIAEQDFVEDGHNRDLVGHGTHVAATIGSNDSRYRGVAPGAQLLSGKVCMEVGCPDSAILAGMQWAAEQGAKVVNLSLGGGDTPEQDPLEAAVEDLTARFGTLFVIAAGNAGEDETIGSPGSADSALTVGAVTKADELADFSSRGPRVGDAALKPDITAPGVDIVAARGKDAVFGEPGDTHVALSGTSMATPHIAGAAAILAQQHPDWTPAAIKAALMGSAAPNPTVGAYAQGAGRVDVARAIGQTVRSEPASVSFGRQLWPHSDDAPIARTVTYRNLGGAAVTLDLSLTGGAPAGMFTLSADTVTIPAGGTANVTLTANTAVASPDTRFGGHLVARAGNLTVTTPFAVDKEVESYDVTLRHVDRTGQPAQTFFTLLFEPTAIRFVAVFDTPNTTRRMPKGKYVVLTDIAEGEEGATHTHLVASELNVDRRRTLTLDARTGKPISVTVPQPDAVPVEASTNTAIEAPGGGTAIFQVEGDSFASMYAGPAGQRTRNPLVTATVAGVWAKDGVDVADSPYVTQVSFREKGRMFAGLTKRLAKGDLAVVEADHAAQGSSDGRLFASASWPDGPPVFFGFSTPVKLPGKRVEYYNVHDGARWRRDFLEGDFVTGLGNDLDAPLAAYQAGKRYREHRNRAVFGPGFSNPARFPEYWVTRKGDTMTLVPLVSNDQLNWAGWPTDGQLRLTVDLNGHRALDAPTFVQVEAPAQDAEYRLGVELTRGAPSVLSTKVTAAWTFHSSTVAGDAPKPLPLSAVRFLPPLDNTNTAPAGCDFAVPFEVQRQPGSAAGTARTLTVDVSYDDGATWLPARVTRNGQRGVAHVHHPAGTGFVSLRTSSTDTAGNTVEQTVIRAYRIA